MLRYPLKQLLPIIRMLTDVSSSSFLISSAFLLTCFSPFLHTSPSPRSSLLSSGPLPVLAVVVPSSLMSPGIRDLRLARPPVSPLIHSQVAPCTANDLDRLTHDPESVVMGSQGDSGICRRLNLRLCRRPKRGKTVFSLRVPQIRYF